MGNILVTGSSGYIGKLLIQKLKSLGHFVFEFDVKENKIFDIRNIDLIEKIIKKFNINIVYHLAALRNVDYCQNNSNAFDVNSKCAINIYNLCVIHDIKFIFASTISVLDVKNSYSLSKLHVEKNIKNAAILRLSNVVGAYDGYDWNKYPSLTENIFLSYINKKNMIIYGDCIRNYVFIEDVVNDFIELINKPIDVYESKGVINTNTVNWFNQVLNYFSFDIVAEKRPQKSHDAFCFFKIKSWDNAYFDSIMKTYLEHLGIARKSPFFFDQNKLTSLKIYRE